MAADGARGVCEASARRGPHREAASPLATWEGGVASRTLWRSRYLGTLELEARAGVGEGSDRWRGGGPPGVSWRSWCAGTPLDEGGVGDLAPPTGGPGSHPFGAGDGAGGAPGGGGGKGRGGPPEAGGEATWTRFIAPPPGAAASPRPAGFRKGMAALSAPGPRSWTAAGTAAGDRRRWPFPPVAPPHRGPPAGVARGGGAGPDASSRKPEWGEPLNPEESIPRGGPHPARPLQPRALRPRAPLLTRVPAGFPRAPLSGGGPLLWGVQPPPPPQPSPPPGRRTAGGAGRGGAGGPLPPGAGGLRAAGHRGRRGLGPTFNAPRCSDCPRGPRHRWDQPPGWLVKAHLLGWSGVWTPPHGSRGWGRTTSSSSPTPLLLALGAGSGSGASGRGAHPRIQRDRHPPLFGLGAGGGHPTGVHRPPLGRTPTTGERRTAYPGVWEGRQRGARGRFGREGGLSPCSMTSWTMPLRVELGFLHPGPNPLGGAGQRGWRIPRRAADPMGEAREKSDETGGWRSFTELRALSGPRPPGGSRADPSKAQAIRGPERELFRTVGLRGGATFSEMRTGPHPVEGPLSEVTVPPLFRPAPCTTWGRRWRGVCAAGAPPRRAPHRTPSGGWGGRPHLSPRRAGAARQAFAAAIALPRRGGGRPPPGPPSRRPERRRIGLQLLAFLGSL